MTRFDGFHLPGFDVAAAGVSWAELRAGELAVRYAVLGDVHVRTLADGLRERRAGALLGRPVRDIVAALDAAARHLSRRGDLREQAIALLPETTRFSRPMIELILDRMAADWRADALERLLAAELGDAAVLDGFVEDAQAGRRVMAVGPSLTLNVFAGNVPGVAVTALVRCLLVKSAAIGKTAADDPVLPVLFARALERVDARLAACLAVTYWPGGTGEAEDRALAESDTIVVYGGAEAVASVRARAPASARVLEHGPRMSLGFIARETLGADRARSVARAVALAAATFDQHGCVSLHAAFVERGGETSPAAFARLVFEELQALEAGLPRGRLLPDEAAALHAERARAEFGVLVAGGFVLGVPGVGATVVHAETPDATPSCLDRLVRVSAVDDLAEGVDAVRHLRSLLQTAGLAAPAERRTGLADALARAGFTRVTSFEAMPWPPAHWHHDGASPLRELVRWVDLEESGPEPGA